MITATINTVADPRLPPFVCAFDQTPYESLDALHAHIRRFKVSREKYYTTYYPRKDPISGKPIPFKDVDQYLTQEFESKVTMKRWLKDKPEAGYAWAKDWLARRKADKELVYAPSEAELRTLCCPSMSYYETMGAHEGGYYGITRSLDYEDRYTIEPLVFDPLPGDAVITCDTREQAPIKLAHATAAGTLNVGDYALAAPHDARVRIERKSLGDWCGTMSDRKVERKGGRKGIGPTEDSAYLRFDRELERAVAANLYVVMVVEANINDAQRFQYLPQTQWVQASPSHLFHGLRTLLTKYPLTFQCVFVDGRVEMARVIPKIFQLGDRARRHDLQYFYETGAL